MNRNGIAEPRSWSEVLASVTRKETLIMLLLGFVAGLPILLIFSSLSLWLREAGLSRGLVTYFSWAALGYSFKFAWAPLIDRLPVPFLTRYLGRRRSWLLVAQAAVIAAIAGMAYTDPSQGESALTLMAIFAVLLGFSSATQDIVIDAYRIEAAEQRMQALLASAYIAGYRVGMIVAGAGALYLAAYWGSTAETYSYEAWQKTYLCMAAVMLIGVLTTLLMPEPAQSPATDLNSSTDRARLLLMFAISIGAFVLAFSSISPWTAQIAETLGGPIGGLISQIVRISFSIAVATFFGYLSVRVGVVSSSVATTTWVAPIRSFFSEHGVNTALLILALIGLYRISDIVLGVMSNVFYQDMGFTKPEIATAVKTFGVIISIVGSFMGGFLANRYGIIRCLMWGGILAAGTNLAFIALAMLGHNLAGLYIVVGADNLAAGFASAAFVAFLSSLTQISFTAVQYAIFSSLMTLLPKTLGGYSGSIVDTVGYPSFFTITTLLGVPVLWLIYIISKRFDIEDKAALATSS